MKVSFPFYIIIAIIIVSCGNSANNSTETREIPDSLVSKKPVEVSKDVKNEIDSLNTYEAEGRKENEIDSMLDNYELMISRLRNQFFVENQYIAPPGHEYHVHVHPVIELYEELHARQGKMTNEQKSRFRRLTKKIHDTF